MDTKRRRIVTILCAGVAGSLGIAGGVLLGVNGVGTSQSASASSTQETIAYQDSTIEVSPLAKNEAGLTYGSSLGRGTPEAAPDLVEVIGNDGKTGYVHKEHLFPELPESPAEALALSARSSGEFTVPVFESDGTTQIDTFTVNDGAVTTTSK